MKKVKKAGCILIKNNKIALVYREKQKDYSFPKGHMEKNETLKECAIRETNEETKRKCKILIEEPIYIEKYITPSGEDVEMYYYLGKDIGKSNNKSEDTHPTIWISFEEVYDKLSYESLKKTWNNIKDIVKKYIDQEDMFPKEIKKYIQNLPYTEDKTGRSKDKVYNFNNELILKVSNNKERLKREKERVDYINTCNIPGSKSIYYLEKNNKYYYLRTCINGESLCSERFINNPELLINTLVKIVKILRSMDNKKCPFKSTNNYGKDFVHGDLCLPNIYVNNKNEFIGFIDLDNCGVGDKWYDYSWLLWSLEYNFKKDKYNKLLLKKLNLELNIEKYNKYIQK